MALGSSNVRGIYLALIAFGVFAAHDAVIKHLGGAYAPVQILFFSVLMGFPLATIMMMSERGAGTLRPKHPGWIAIRTAAAIATGISGFYAFSTLPLAQVYAFIFAAPLLITILSIPVLGERVGVHRWSAVFLGLIGVLIVLRPGGSTLTLGHGAAMVAAFGSATTSVITRRIGRDERNVVMMLYPMTANVILLGLMLPLVYRPMPIGDFGLLALVAILGFSAGITLIAAYRAGDAAIVAPMQYSQIAWGTAFGFFFFDEFPDFQTFAGVSVIVLAGLYVVLRESVGGRSEHTPVLRTRTRNETASMPRISALLRARADRVLPGYQALARPGESPTADQRGDPTSDCGV